MCFDADKTQTSITWEVFPLPPATSDSPSHADAEALVVSVLWCFQGLIPPSLSALLQAVVRSDRLDLLYDIHQAMLQDGVEVDPYLLSSLAAAYSRDGKFEEAATILEVHLGALAGALGYGVVGSP